MWPHIKTERKRQSLQHLKRKKTIVVGQPFAPIDGKTDRLDIRFVNSSYVLEQGNNLDILFFQGYSRETKAIMDTINSGSVGITAAWFWDNHHLISETTRNALLTDFSFAAHYYKSHYLHDDIYGWSGFTPLCPISWSEQKILAFRDKYFFSERSNNLYGGYNSYSQWPHRDDWLNAVIASDIPTDIRIYPHGTVEHPYYTLSEEDKFAEWATFKTTLCSSFDANTTIRMFDSLLTGSIPILTGEIKDLKMIFTESDFAKYNLIHIEEPTIDNLKRAYDLAITIYDKLGVEGAIERSNFILNEHMPYNRVSSMVSFILNS